MIFKRKIYGQMFAWKQENNGRSALLIEGARRIGKSTVVEQFAKNEYDSYILIDFNNASPSTYALFDDLTNLDMLFLQLQTEYKTVLKRRKSVVIFDEVQQCPKARQAIKYLVQDGRYDYIETGSLISIRRNTEYITIPSEEDRLEMYPMDYEEFLWAIGDNTTTSLLKKCFENVRGLGEQENRRQLRKFRLYMLIGGMPQAVSKYIETNNFRLVDMVKRDIIKLYEDDFLKIDSTGKLSLIFDSIPSQLNSNASRYQVSSIIGNRISNKTLEYIAELKDSKTVLVSYHTNDPNIGMANTKDLAKFKLFICDTGLFTTLMFKDKDFTENIIYEKLLSDKLSINLGYLYENVVAQILAANGNELFYYTMLNETSKHNYEIDFLISKKNKVCPIEVKSSTYKTHKSLDVFCEKYSNRIYEKYLIYVKDLCKDQDILCMPIYMVPFIN